MITGPLSIIALVLATILLVPMICRKIRIPSIDGFILVGILVGQHGLNLFGGVDAIQSLGKLRYCLYSARSIKPAMLFIS